MPLVDFNLKSTWDAMFILDAEQDGHPNTRQGVKLHFHRSVMLPYATGYVDNVIRVLGWDTTPPTSLIITGAGFGFMAEAFEAVGITNVVGADISTYIQSNKGGTEEVEIDAEISAVGLNPASGRGAEIKARHFDGGVRTRNGKGVLNENGNAPLSRGRIKQALGITGNDKADWHLTDNILHLLSDAEATTQSADAALMADNVVHLLPLFRPDAAPHPEPINLKTGDDWKILLPDDTIIGVGRYDVY